MKEFTNYYIIFLLSIITIYYINNKTNEVTYVVSNIDNNKYLVRNEIDKHEAANLLAKICKKLIKFNTYITNKFPNLPFVKRLNNNFNPKNINEASESSKYTSYSINKGEKVVLCLRSRDNKNKIIDENTLLFVALHELTHIGTKSIGHTDEFWSNFKFVLKHSVEMGIYRYDDYNKKPRKYCGIKITDQPLNDKNIK